MDDVEDDRARDDPNEMEEDLEEDVERLEDTLEEVEKVEGGEVNLLEVLGSPRRLEDVVDELGGGKFPQMFAVGTGMHPEAIVSFQSPKT